MKKTLTLSLPILAIFLLSGCSNQVKVEPKTEAYYDNFRKICEQKNESKSCCLSSVDNAEQEGSLIYEKNDVVCPGGSAPIMNKCIDSYKWCSNSPK